MSLKPQIALFVCDDVVGLLMTNQIVEQAVSMGIDPVIINTRHHRNREFKIPTPPLVSAFNSTILRESIAPFLEEKGHLDHANLTYKQLAKKYALEYWEVDDINDPNFLNKVGEQNKLIGGVSVRFLQVFEKNIIGAFRDKGFLWNLHSGLLPDYKGLLTPYRAITNGEKEYGLTLHQTACGIDEGKIIQTSALPLDPKRPIMDLYLDSIDGGVEILMASLQQILSDGEVEARHYPATKIPNYYTNPTAQEFNDFTRRGVFYVEPNDTVERLSELFGCSLHSFLKSNHVVSQFPTLQVA